MSQDNKCDLPCCLELDKIREYVGVGIDRTILTDEVLAEHIRKCCGHGPFLSELFADYSEQSIFAWVDSVFFIYLARILEKDFHNDALYERFWGCIPFLRAMMLDKPGLPRLDQILSKCSPLNPEIFINFLVCRNELPSFTGYVETFLGNTSIFDLRSEDVGILIEWGYDLPDCIVNMYNQVNRIMSYEKKLLDHHNSEYDTQLVSFSPYFCITTDEDYFSGDSEERGSNLEITLDSYYEKNNNRIKWDNHDIFIWGKTLLGIDKETFGDMEIMCKEFTDCIQIEDFKILLNSLTLSNIPLYHNDHPIYLEKSSYAKLARK